MNYRHGFHAGNFADVFKHAALSRILIYLAQKDSPFRVVDTHAGAGFHALDSDAARRTGEWHDGIGRIVAGAVPADVAGLLRPWLDLVAGAMAQAPPVYPGSPALAQHLTRAQDRLIFCEKHPDEARDLAAAFAGDRRIKTVPGDGWAQLQSLLPPPERRGLVVIDPPFEETNEVGAIIDALDGALRRFATGVYLVWYPIKGRRDVDSFARKLARLPAARILRAEIGLYPIERVDRLNGCGVAIVNPPWKLDEELKRIAEYMAPILAREGGGDYRVEWLKFD